MALKITWRTILSRCFKPNTPPLVTKNQSRKQGSPRRISFTESLSVSATDLSNSLLGSNLHVFTLAELKVITHNFSSGNYLGKGGFGPVYKGFIDDKTRPGLRAQSVAVKSLDLDGTQGHREWLTEVIFLGQLRHSHLVKLIGYCCEDEHRLLVYEYMPCGNLENQLFGKYSIPLPWSTRIKIAVGAARGLAFLHGEEKPVIYRDFKASNILLDPDYTAKLSDFGLAKDGPEGDETHVTTRVMGTQGYAAPEYIMTGHLTTMSDVYSFGVVLLELLTGRRAVDKARPSREQCLVGWARPLLRDQHKVERIIDPRLEGQYSREGAKKAALLAYQCLSHQAKSRPAMNTVVETLESLMGLDDIPVGFFVYTAPPEDQNGKDCQERANGESREKVTEKREKGNEGKEMQQTKKADGCLRHQNDCRHRHRIRRLRSGTVHSDTTLYTTLKE